MKKILTLLLAAGLLTATLTGMASANGDATDALPPTSYYRSVTGTVISVEETENGLRVKIEDEHGNPAILNITDRTVYPFEDEIAEGDVVTGYYVAMAPMIMIWPAQYNIAVLVNGKPENVGMVVDRFSAWEGSEGFKLSQSGQLAFGVDEDTVIVLPNGDSIEYGEIDGRRMIVLYGPFVTASFPAQATANKVIVLYEDVVSHDDMTMQAPDYAIDATGWPILVDGEQIDAPAAFQTEDGILMIPLRAVAEALGFDVNWDGAMRSVRLGVAIHLWIGNTEVHVGRMAPINISATPRIVNGSTYVPLDFFRNVLNVPNAFAFEGQIEIHSQGERME
jgi:hypothetical protein